MSLVDFLNKIKLSEALQWMGNYRLFYVNNRKFWNLIFNQSPLGYTKQILFYILVDILVLLIISPKLSVFEGARILFLSVMFRYVVVVLVLYFSSLIFRKGRVRRDNIFRDATLLPLFTFLFIFPFETISFSLFIRNESFLFLFIFNLIGFLTTLYFYVYSSLIFFRMWRTRIFAFIANFLLLNFITIIVSLLLHTEKNEKGVKVDPVYYEYEKSIMAIPELKQITHLF